MAQNTYATSVSNISRVGSTLSFDMTNIGGNSRMLLNGIGSNSMVIGPDGKGISYIHTDDGLIVVGPAGKYSIQEMIASSMSKITYTNATNIVVSGTANGDFGIASISWSNAVTGASGACSGTTILERECTSCRGDQ